MPIEKPSGPPPGTMPSGPPRPVPGFPSTPGEGETRSYPPTTPTKGK